MNDALYTIKNEEYGTSGHVLAHKFHGMPFKAIYMDDDSGEVVGVLLTPTFEMAKVAATKFAQGVA